MEVADLIRNFERIRTGRVVIAGHGIFRVGDTSQHEQDVYDDEEEERLWKKKKKRSKKKNPRLQPPKIRPYAMETGKSGAASMQVDQSGKFQVPQGMSIYFYCEHADVVLSRLCHPIEGFSRGKPTKPKEVIKGGGWCYNYRLLYAYGLELNMTAIEARYDVITIDESQRYRAVPLTTLLRDSRCQNASEIHWCACRGLSTNQLDWRSEILFGSASDRRSFDSSRKFAGSGTWG